jgi:hypothetical protein
MERMEVIESETVRETNHSSLPHSPVFARGRSVRQAHRERIRGGK